jgi:hypothetical protein
LLSSPYGLAGEGKPDEEKPGEGKPNGSYSTIDCGFVWWKAPAECGLFFAAALRRRHARKTTKATKETKRQAPMVPPTIAPRLGFDEPEDDEELEEVGVLIDSLVTVAVTVSSAAELVDTLIPRLWYAVLVNALAAQPYCVRIILS